MSGLVNFRIFFADGTSVDIQAPNAAIARSRAEEGKPGIQITKVKVMKGEPA